MAFLAVMSILTLVSYVLIYSTYVGLALLVLEEIGLKPCRLCTSWWLSVAYCLYTWDLWPLPVIMLVSNFYYVLLNRVVK